MTGNNAEGVVRIESRPGEFVDSSELADLHELAAIVVKWSGSHNLGEASSAERLGDLDWPCQEAVTLRLGLDRMAVGGSPRSYRQVAFEMDVPEESVIPILIEAAHTMRSAIGAG